MAKSEPMNVNVEVTLDAEKLVALGEAMTEVGKALDVLADGIGNLLDSIAEKRDGFVSSDTHVETVSDHAQRPPGCICGYTQINEACDWHGVEPHLCEKPECDCFKIHLCGDRHEKFGGFPLGHKVTCQANAGHKGQHWYARTLDAGCWWWGDDPEEPPHSGPCGTYEGPVEHLSPPETIYSQEDIDEAMDRR